MLIYMPPSQSRYRSSDFLCGLHNAYSLLLILTQNVNRLRRPHFFFELRLRGTPTPKRTGKVLSRYGCTTQLAFYNLLAAHL